MELSRNNNDKRGKQRNENYVVNQFGSPKPPVTEAEKNNLQLSLHEEAIVHPKPAFTVRTKSSLTNIKGITVNVWSDDAVSKPVQLDHVNDSGEEKSQWSIPLCLSRPINYLDKNGDVFPAHNAVVHTETVGSSERSQCFQKAIISAILEAAGESEVDSYELMSLKEPSPFNKTVITRGTFAKEKAAVLKEPQFDVKYLFGEINEQEEDSVFESRPSGLKVEIYLPEMVTAKTVDLDVEEGKLHMMSTDPESYRLLLNFCYPVDEEKGSAKFDRDSQRLLVHLPIKSAGFVDQTLVGEETILRETTFTRTVFGKAGMDDECLITPGYTCHFYDELMVCKLYVKNVLEESLEKTCLNLCKGSGFSLKFRAKEESAPVDVKYGFDIIFLNLLESFEYSLDSVEVEIWDNNVIIQMALPAVQCKSYMVGLHPDNLKENTLPQLRAFKNKRKEALLSTQTKEPTLVHLISDSETESEKERHSSGDSAFSVADSESSFDTDQILEPPCKKELELEPKQQLQGILKRGRCASESSAEHFRLSSSVSIESSIPEDGILEESSFKKTVRFSNVVHRQVFRTNSSIVGQRQPRWKKTELKKKRAIQRSLSESDAQYLEFQDFGPDNNVVKGISKATSLAELEATDRLDEKTTLSCKSESDEWDSGLASSSEDCNSLSDSLGRNKKGSKHKAIKKSNVKSLTNKYADLKISIH